MAKDDDATRIASSDELALIDQFAIHLPDAEVPADFPPVVRFAEPMPEAAGYFANDYDRAVAEGWRRDPIYDLNDPANPAFAKYAADMNLWWRARDTWNMRQAEIRRSLYRYFRAETMVVARRHLLRERSKNGSR